MNIEQTVARDLLSIQAVFFRPVQPFTCALTPVCVCVMPCCVTSSNSHTCAMLC